MKNKGQIYLEKQLHEYEQQTNMTESERRALHRWVKAGHSVYEAPGSLYHCDGPEDDFLDIYREDNEIGRALEGKTDSEKSDWLKANFGYDKTEVREKPTYEEMRARIRDLNRELFYLWSFIDQEGFHAIAEQYVKENACEPVPFEYEYIFPQITVSGV